MPVTVSRSPFNRSPPTRAEWIEIILTLLIIDTPCSSPPTRAEWIEILTFMLTVDKPGRLRPHGRSGLKYQSGFRQHWPGRLRPHGRSGLKSVCLCGMDASIPSPPTRAEWIEICFLPGIHAPNTSPPTRAEWIEITKA